MLTRTRSAEYEVEDGQGQRVKVSQHGRTLWVSVTPSESHSQVVSVVVQEDHAYYCNYMVQTAPSLLHLSMMDPQPIRRAPAWWREVAADEEALKSSAQEVHVWSLELCETGDVTLMVASAGCNTAFPGQSTWPSDLALEPELVGLAKVRLNCSQAKKPKVVYHNVEDFLSHHIGTQGYWKLDPGWTAELRPSDKLPVVADVKSDEGPSYPMVLLGHWLFSTTAPSPKPHSALGKVLLAEKQGGVLVAPFSWTRDTLSPGTGLDQHTKTSHRAATQHCQLRGELLLLGKHPEVLDFFATERHHCITVRQIPWVLLLDSLSANEEPRKQCEWLYQRLENWMRANALPNASNGILLLSSDFVRSLDIANWAWHAQDCSKVLLSAARTLLNESSWHLMVTTVDSCKDSVDYRNCEREAQTEARILKGTAADLEIPVLDARAISMSLSQERRVWSHGSESGDRAARAIVNTLLYAIPLMWKQKERQEETVQCSKHINNTRTGSFWEGGSASDSTQSRTAQPDHSQVEAQQSHSTISQSKGNSDRRLGLVISPVYEQQAGAKTQVGLRVNRVIEGGLAASTGMVSAGMRLEAVNGVPVSMMSLKRLASEVINPAILGGTAFKLILRNDTASPAITVEIAGS